MHPTGLDGCVEHDKALKRVITAMFRDDAQLFKQFQDNQTFRRWLTLLIVLAGAGRRGCREGGWHLRSKTYRPKTQIALACNFTQFMHFGTQ